MELRWTILYLVTCQIAILTISSILDSNPLLLKYFLVFELGILFVCRAVVKKPDVNLPRLAAETLFLEFITSAVVDLSNPNLIFEMMVQYFVAMSTLTVFISPWKKVFVQNGCIFHLFVWLLLLGTLISFLFSLNLVGSCLNIFRCQVVVWLLSS